MTAFRITVNGKSFRGARGELLLDAALRNGIEIPYDCRAGHCGTCCVRVLSGDVRGGLGSEPGIVHACQCRIAGDAVVEKADAVRVRTVDCVLSSLRRLSSEVLEVGITPSRALPSLAGQYAQVRFDGFPSRPYSITLPVHGNSDTRKIWFHIRQMKDGRVTAALGKRIKLGHRVKLTGPYGSAYFRAHRPGRIICVATNTGFAPIWSIAVAALREAPQRNLMVIVGGRSLQSLYMGPALARLAAFPNVRVVPVCSNQQSKPNIVWPGRPTDYLPPIMPTDVLYACGSPNMVESMKSIAARVGVVCHADPFLPAAEATPERGMLTRATGWLAGIPAGQ